MEIRKSLNDDSIYTLEFTRNPRTQPKQVCHLRAVAARRKSRITRFTKQRAGRGRLAVQKRNTRLCVFTTASLCIHNANKLIYLDIRRRCSLLARRPSRCPRCYNNSSPATLRFGQCCCHKQWRVEFSVRLLSEYFGINCNRCNNDRNGADDESGFGSTLLQITIIAMTMII